MIRVHLICVIACTCLSHISAKAQLQYRTNELNRLTQALQLNPDSMLEGQNNLLVNGRLIRAQVDNGVLNSLGYCLFSDDLKTMAHTPILNFLERYFLQLDHPEKDRPANRMLREDRFVFNKGSLASIATIQQDDGFSFGYEHKYYWATWTRNGQELLSVSFPANHELISGEAKIEAEKNVETDIRVSQLGPTKPVNKEMLTSTLQKDYYVKQGSTYLSKLLTSNLYYQQSDSTFSLICNESHPLESAANMMLSPDSQAAFNLKVKQIMYGFKKKFFDVPLYNWIAYCVNNGCELYFGVESFEREVIRASVFAVNIAENYNHVLFVNIPLKIIGQGSGDIEAQLETFVPMHNVLNMFAKYKKKTNKQTKIYEQ